MKKHENFTDWERIRQTEEWFDGFRYISMRRLQIERNLYKTEQSQKEFERKYSNLRTLSDLKKLLEIQGLKVEDIQTRADHAYNFSENFNYDSVREGYHDNLLKKGRITAEERESLRQEKSKPN